MSAITVDGNGSTIDGAATARLGVGGISVTFIYVAGQYRRITSRHSFEVAGQIVEAALDTPPEPPTSTTIAAARGTALDANHLHAWELVDAAGSFADTGSSATKVAMPIVGQTPLYQSPGMFGPCVQFGIDSIGGLITGGGSVLTSAFNDLPGDSATLELWFRSYAGNLGMLAGSSDGAERFMLSGNGAVEVLAGTVYANVFHNMVISAVILPVAKYTWQHAAIVRNHVTGEDFIYLNGEILAKTVGQVGALQWNATPATQRIQIANGSAGSFRGQMSRVRISNVARSQAYLRGVYSRAVLLA
ncbi:MAG: LamG-like jellyroll fold domain-containing protein [Gemmatimonadaceae bacterium]